MNKKLEECQNLEVIYNLKSKVHRIEADMIYEVFYKETDGNLLSYHNFHTMNRQNSSAQKFLVHIIR